ncbi:hypothetical protein FSP39_010274 [Pinctada imbricata]|uniref:Uncharacterized protein n=1 Tax=Pinctada imbricata TaxID=66713 RepID=A0AA89C3A6_PINIB|nr:hypothetical protein FSP39_010274 [Pinctada imbricata]
MHLSRLFIVYVDHNERNIILEDPDQELGDLRRTTVQAAIKMGAIVFVVYTHDRGSENLKEGQLYNERLASITKHTVLSPLNEKHRVLSINKDFMAHQRTHLQKEICNVLDKKNK